jgi:hypothetical protein
MPRSRSRITLTLTKVRTLKLGDVGTEDAFRKGMTAPSSCSKSYECSHPGWPGLGAWEDLVSSAAGGRPWKECWCVLPNPKEYWEGRRLAWDESMEVHLLNFQADVKFPT